MAWPTSQDYNEAIQSPASAFSDPELRGGEARANAMGMPLPRSGNFADVYEFTGASGAKWAVKCFTREVAGLQERYHEISRFLQKAKLPFMVDFQYLAQGIRISGRWYPILKMHWVDGYLLNEFVGRNLNKPRILEALGEIWVRMAQRLRGAGIAHADLQHGNVILVPGSKSGSLAVKLIDYDGMFVPALAGKPSGEVGHPNFQHPQRLEKNIYCAEVDRLPFLSVACALRALVAAGPSLWEKHDNGDNLLFRANDLAKPGESKLLRELWSLNDAELHDLVAYLVSGLTNPLRETPLLPDLMRDNALQPPPPAIEKATQYLLGPGATITRAAGKAVKPIRAAGTWEEAYDPFADLVSSTTITSVYRRRKSTSSGKKWALWGGLGLGGAALILVTVLALSGGGKDNASHAESKPPPVEDKKPKEQQVVQPKPKPPDDPARIKLPDAEKPILLVGIWRLEGNELVQDSLAVPAALLVGSPNWGDCDLAVDIRTTQGADSIWLPIGATPSGDHDAFCVGGFDKQGEAALVHAVNGKMEVEGTRTMARLERNTWHSVTVKRRGDQSSLYLDGTLVAEGSTALPARFGLGALATKARFRNLKITDPNGEILCAAMPDPFRAQQPDRPQIAGGTWRVEDDELVQDGRPNPAMLFFGSAAWSDYDVTLNCKAVEGAEGFMICFRALDPGNFHCFNLGGNGNKNHELVCFTNGRAAPDAPPLPGRIEVDRWYEAAVKVRGQDIACYLGGKLLFQAKDELLPKGKVGLRTFNTKARFRDIKVTDPAGNELWSGLPQLESAPLGKERVFWLHSRGFFRRGNGSDWVEHGDADKFWYFKEVNRTDDMVELHDKSRDCWLHLHHDSCWIRFGATAPWRHIYGGQWKNVPFLIDLTSPKDAKPVPVVITPSFFNGKDLTGWEGLDGFWRVEDGALVGAVPEGKKPVSTFLCTTRPYRDFDFKFQARLKDGIGNSGVQFRSKISDFDKFTVTGPQCEICGDDGQRLYPTGSVIHEPKGRPFLFAPLDKVKLIFKEDQFNDYHIHVKHKHVTVQLNGEKLVDDEYSNMPTSGIIALQFSARSPPREVAFRNFKFTDLKGDFYHLFDGKTLNGWKAVLTDVKADPKKTFLVKDGTLVVTGKPTGNVHTVGSYKNYVVRFEWRFKRPADLKDESQFKGDSGLYLHMTGANKAAPKCVQIQITQQEYGRFIPMNGPKGSFQFNRLAVMGARRSVGDWNEAEVTCNDGAITCKLNGVQVSSGKYDCDQGNIGLESFGGEEVQFRQIMLKEIWPGDDTAK
ncbi:MAG: DUF1080 domain-containing protein [Planctomycetes bacterium]|nr:DUF1080 domain-containing protein [Planctomycetota bacterium]